MFEVVVGGVGKNALVCSRCQPALYGIEIVGKFHLLQRVVHTVEAHILCFPVFGINVKGIGNLLRKRHPPPGGFFYAAALRVGAGQPVFKKLPRIGHDVFRNISEIEIQVPIHSAIGGIGVSSITAEGVEVRAHQPKFDELDVGRLKVVGVQCPHNAAPTGAGALQPSARIETSGKGCTPRNVEVVRAALTGVVVHVENLGVGVAKLLGRREVGKNLLLPDGQSIGVALVGALPPKAGVYAKPTEVSAVYPRQGGIPAL